jgi:predicted O-methyltransferase YrrM
MNAVAEFVREIASAPHYRGRPVESLRYAYAKWLFGRFRQNDPLRFLESLGIELDFALDRFDRWRKCLQDVVEKVQDENSGQGGISFDDGLVLYGLARALRPKVIIETGVAAGVSTSFLAAALVENRCGQLFSIEMPPERTTRTFADGSRYAWRELGVAWAIPPIIKRSIGERHELILQDARVALPNVLRSLTYVDIFFHDDLHTPDHMLWEYESVWPRLCPGGVLLSDDANHGWVRFCRRQGFRGSTAFANLNRLCGLRKPAEVQPPAMSLPALLSSVPVVRGAHP